jgi:hypothetical protein
VADVVDTLAIEGAAVVEASEVRATHGTRKMALRTDLSQPTECRACGRALWGARRGHRQPTNNEEKG